MAKVELCRMTWREAEDAFRMKPVILIPMGSTEEHGPHVPVGDYRYAAEVARRIAEQTDAIVAPTIPWGYSDFFRPFPGTVSIRPETLTFLLQDICASFVRFGLDHLLFICCHDGNVPIIEQVARQIREIHRLRTAMIQPWAWVTLAFKQAAYGDKEARTGHGSEPMGSMAMALFPEDLRPDLVEADGSRAFGGLRFRTASQAEFEGVPVHVYLDFDEVTRNGVMGDPALSSAEAGQKLLEHVVEIGSKFVRHFTTMGTRIEDPPGGQTVRPR